jgi:plasmid stabilization system protein ParE
MADSTTLTVRLAPEVKRRLESVAVRVRRSKSFLAAEANRGVPRRAGVPYRIVGDTIHILRVFDSACRWPAEL